MSDHPLIATLRAARLVPVVRTRTAAHAVSRLAAAQGGPSESISE